MDIGERLREQRHAKGWTLDDLDELTGFSAPYLSKIERNRVIPAAETLGTIGRILGVEPDELGVLLEQRRKLELAEKLELNATIADPLAEALVAVRELDDNELAVLAEVLVAVHDLDQQQRSDLAEPLRDAIVLFKELDTKERRSLGQRIRLAANVMNQLDAEHRQTFIVQLVERFDHAFAELRSAPAPDPETVSELQRTP